MLSKEKQLKWEEYLYFKKKLGLHTCICEEMEIKNETGRNINESGNWTSISLERYGDNNELWYICAHGDDAAGVKINYCPFCGKKLGE